MVHRVVALATLLLLTTPRPAHALLPAVQPHGIRATSNGFAALVVREDQAKVADFLPHLYAHAAPAKTTPDLLYDAYFGLRVASGKPTWGNTLAHPLAVQAGDDTQFGYLGATGIVHDLRTLDGVTLDTLTFAPMGLSAPGYMLLARVSNPQASAVTVDLALLLNHHVGAGTPDPSPDAERIRALGPQTLVEDALNSPHRLLYRAVGPESVQLEATNPYARWMQGQAFGDTTDSGTGPDRVAGMAWTQLTLAPGQERLLGALVLYGADASDADLQAQASAWLAGRTPAQLLADEQGGWQAWHGTDVVPKGLDTQSDLLLRRSLALLRMGQVREPDFGPPHTNQTPHGQIVASLPPGIWHIAWVRDQAYAGVALAAGGHGAEAREALDFVLHGQTGGYLSYIGSPYLTSPVRYFGGGLEESDADANGPNIEHDGPGLLLWQAWRYVQATNDAAWLTGAWPDLRDKTADLLVKLVDAQGLIAADSGPWEVHWNGQQKHFTFSSVQAVRGLCAAARLAVIAGEGKLAPGYRQAAQGLRAAIVARLVGSDGVLRGNLEEDAGLDAAAVEAFLDGTVDPGGQVALATWQAWHTKLAAGGGPGLFRNDDGGVYDSAEWLFIDLRVLRMLERMVAAGQPVQAEAIALRQRVLAVVQAGGGLVPELIATQGPGIGQFDGAIPMMGFGSGALVLALGGEAFGDDLGDCLAVPSVADAGPNEQPEPAPEPTPDVGTTADLTDTLDDGPPLPDAALPQYTAPRPASGCTSTRAGPSLPLTCLLVLALLVPRRFRCRPVP
jgi:GH15 family glucan-1,4-alpha-glucosidase